MKRNRLEEEIKKTKQWIMENPRWLRIVYRLLAMAATLYVVGVLWLVPELVGKVGFNPAYFLPKAMIGLAIGIAFYYFLLWSTYMLRDFRFHVYSWQDRQERAVTDREKQWKVFLMGCIPMFAMLFIYYFAFYPGCATTDNFYQWQQIQNGTYDNWHPAFHTFFMWFLSRIVNQYSFLVLVQILSFSLVCGWLVKTLYAWHFPMWSILLCEAFLVLHPQTHHIMLYLWKDSAFTIAGLAAIICMIEIFLSKGLWLQYKKNMAVMGILLVCLSLLRHNGILWSYFLMALLFIIGRKFWKKTVIVTAATFAAIALIEGPIYDAAGVEYFEYQTYTEAVGLPMTILGNIRTLSPEVLSERAADFLNTAAVHEVWVEYELGAYNSIKSGRSADALNQLTAVPFLEITAETVKDAPALSLQAVYQLTRMLWDVRGEKNWQTPLEIRGEDYGYPIYWVEERGNLRQVLADFDAYLFEKFPIIFAFVGVYLAIMILSTVITFFDKGLDSLYMVLPILAYSYGTMLLLSGRDYRFFHVLCVTCIPVSMALFSRVPESAGDSGNGQGEKEKAVSQEAH